MTTSPQKIAIVDRRSATLYALRRDAKSNLRLDRISRIENENPVVHEHHRPDALGRGPSANAAQHFASHGHDEEEFERRHARHVAAWLVAGAAGAELTIFAGGRLFAVLRDEIESIAVGAMLQQLDLAPMSVSELVRHPAIARALDGGRPLRPL